MSLIYLQGIRVHLQNVCKVLVDRVSGKQDHVGGGYRCYASASERFPSVREHRWKNFEYLLNGGEIIIPEKAKFIRIHGSGDFYSQAYFDKWLEVIRKHPDKTFWAFTKSLGYWVNRINEIPSNLSLTASYGSLQDHLIEEYGLRWVKVYDKLENIPKGLQIDVDDSLAMYQAGNFALLDNFNKEKKMLKVNK